MLTQMRLTHTRARRAGLTQAGLLVGLVGMMMATGPAGGPGAAAPAPGTNSGAGDAARGPTSEFEKAAESFGGAKSETKPSRDVVMQFTFATEIREIAVVGGQKVKRGDVLVRSRDAEIKAAIDQQRALAESDLEVQNSGKARELAEFKFNQLKAGTAFSPTEFEEARIGAETARLQNEQAKVNAEQQRLRLKQLEAQYERYYLEAPFDGVVEEVLAEVGQGVTENEKVLRLVNTGTLWLDCWPPTSETLSLGLKENSPAWVLVDVSPAAKIVRGRVLYVSPVADSVSQTRRVRVEISNPDAWPAGTPARVRFVEPSGGGSGTTAGTERRVMSEAQAGQGKSEVAHRD